jgi:O-antigen/teichoic acid export membrane protein
MALSLLTLGLPSSIYFFYNRIESAQRPALICQTLGMMILAGAVAALAIAVGTPLLARSMSNPDLLVVLPLYALAIGLTMGGEHLVSFMVAQNRYASAVAFETVETFVRVGTLVVPILLGYGLQGLVVAAVLYAGVRFVVRNAWVLRTGSDPVLARPPRATWFTGEQLGYSLPLWATSIVGALGGVLDRAIIAGSFTPVDYAIYSVGALSIPLDVIFQASVADVLRASLPPLIKEGNLVEVRRLLREAVRKLSLVMLPSFVFLLGFSREFITLLFTNQYAGSVEVFRIYLFFLPLYSLVLSLVPQVFGKTRINLYIVFGATLFHAVLSVVLLKTIGFYGPALSGVVCAWLFGAVYLKITSSLAGGSIADVLPVAAIVKTLLCGAAALGASRLAGDWTSARPVNLVIHGALYTLVFFAAGMATRLFTAQDRSLARRWIAKLVPALKA